MADYNSDRTGANIDATLDKVDALVDSGNNVTADSLTVETGSGNTYPTASTSADNLIISNKTASEPSGITIFSDNASQGTIFFGDEQDADNGRIVYDHNGNANTMSFHANGAERARIDSSGNLLVGKTSADNTTVGMRILGSEGFCSIVRDGAEPLVLNRLTNDGILTEYRKNGSTVGSIGVYDGRPYLASATVGIRVSNALFPSDTSGAVTDGAMNIGGTTGRFKDLYLSGGVITSSDYRLKEDVQPMQSYADTIRQMNLVNFAWKDSGKREDGFIAHELQALVPSAVRGDKDAIDEDGNEQYQGVDPLKLIPVLTKALQEALERIEILENK